MYRAMNMDDVIRYNKEVGQHFFDENAMKCWGSRVMSDLLPGDLFITEEDNYDQSKKLYTVRKFDPETAEIDDASEFQQFRDVKEAYEFAEEWYQEQ